MGRRKKGDKVDGWVNLDKPAGMTSTQAVGKVRWLLNAQKAGHAGTLDPLATGILPIALGEATKTVNYAQDALKTYRFTITWGESRDTQDAEGTVIGTSDARPAPEDIEAALSSYIGDIEQVPPKYSAIKVDGNRAYDLARGGEEFELKARFVFIKELKIIRHLDRSDSEVERSLVTHEDPSTSLGMTIEKTEFLMTCGKGTYVRSLARDLAADLGTCGYISMLRREAVGGFSVENAISLDKLEEMSDSAARMEVLLPVESSLDDIPALLLKENEAARLRNGQTLAFISRPDFQRLADAGLENGGEALAVSNDKPVALVEIDGPDIRPVRVLNL